MGRDPIEILIGLPVWLVVIVFSHPLVLLASLGLLFYWGRRGGRGQRAARTLLLLGAISSTGLAALFVYVGYSMNWSTDGPGLLVVFMGIGGFGILAIVTWILWAARRRKS